MALILGIDAAWTEKGSSGVALLDTANGGRLIACAPSYSSFMARADDKAIWHRPQPGPLDAAELLQVAKRLGNADVDVVAIDMPISSVPFSARRAADQEISKEFGKAWAATHSPNAERPGVYGHRVSEAFIKAGYRLATSQRGVPALIEVYPLAALVRLLNVPKRPVYKVSKGKSEWPKLTRDQRIGKLLQVWRCLSKCLNKKIANLNFSIPKEDSIETLSALKPYEDGLDAIICALVGALYFSDSAQAYGDDQAAIWVPQGSASLSMKDAHLKSVADTLTEWSTPSDCEAFRTL
jgi:predicted RNase H-like nuclease